MTTPAPKPPTEPDKIDPAWLSWQLRKADVIGEEEVVSVTAEAFGDSVGFLSRMARLVPEYSRKQTSAPSTIVIKVETIDPRFRAMSDRLGAFAREIGFYENMAPIAPTRLARVYAGGTDEGVSWILMEDLGRLAPGDQIRGLSNRQIEMALRHIGAVHAASWEQSGLKEHAWLPANDFLFQDDFRQIWPNFRDHYELRIGHEATALLERLLEREDRLEARIAERPYTLVHGDLRADNLLLGEEGTDEEVLILDWQTATRSLGTIDVAQLIGGSEPPPERAGHYRGLFDAWLATLRRHGVAHYGGEDAHHDLCLGLLTCMRIPLQAFKALGGPDFATARAAQLADVLILRHTSAALEFDAGEHLP